MLRLFVPPCPSHAGIFSTMTPRSACKPPWHLYVVRTVDNCLYAGIATDVTRRYREHVAGGARAAGYLRAHRPEALVFTRRIGSRSLALKVEYRFKHLSKTAKERIVAAGHISFDERTGRIDER